MLGNVREVITITGESIVGDIAIESYRAELDFNNPKEMDLQTWIVAKELYKENREQCRKDKADFEELAFAEQEKILSRSKGENK